METTTSLSLTKVISGGQTGADQAGLKAAKSLGIPTGGTAPFQYMTTKGPMKSLLRDTYKLEEGKRGYSMAGSYVGRSIKNIVESDGSLVFRDHCSTGTDRTIGYCVTNKWCSLENGNAYDWLPNEDDWITAYWEYTKGFKPVFVIKDVFSVKGRRLACEAARKFIVDNRIKQLNVAGHRAKNDNGKWEKRVYSLLLEILK